MVVRVCVLCCVCAFAAPCGCIESFVLVLRPGLFFGDVFSCEVSCVVLTGVFAVLRVFAFLCLLCVLRWCVGSVVRAAFLCLLFFGGSRGALASVFALHLTGGLAWRSSGGVGCVRRRLV